MKNLFLLLFTLLPFCSYAQSISSKRIPQSESVKLLESISSLEIFRGDQIHIAIFKSSNGSGSAKLPESHEVTHNYIFCIAEYDEYPDSKVYSVGPFLNPRITRKSDLGKAVVFSVEEGPATSRKKVQLLVSTSEIQIQ